LRGTKSEPPYVGCYGSGVQCEKFFGEISPRFLLYCSELGFDLHL